MDINYYANLLKKKERHEDAEAFWDSRAEDFATSQNNQKDEMPSQVIKYMQENNLLQEDTTVIDIGGGAGRYAIPMAELVEKVTITDISSQMLKYAQENARKAGLDNLDYVKLDIKTADIKKMAWQGKYDLAFAVMCPAVRNEAGLDKMTALSKNHCCIGQFVERINSVTARIKEALDIPNRHDPHNDREILYAFFNILWLKGFNPRIGYFGAESEEEFTVEEILAEYSKEYNEQAREKDLDLTKIIASFAVNGKINLYKKRTLALMSWQVSTN